MAEEDGQTGVRARPSEVSTQIDGMREELANFVQVREELFRVLAPVLLETDQEPEEFPIDEDPPKTPLAMEIYKLRLEYRKELERWRHAATRVQV